MWIGGGGFNIFESFLRDRANYIFTHVLLSYLPVPPYPKLTNIPLLKHTLERKKEQQSYFRDLMWLLCLCCRYGGSTWSLMRVIVWRTTTVSWPRSSTLTTLPLIACSSLEHHCRTNCQSCGLYLTFCFQASSSHVLHLNSGSMRHLPWLERR